MLVILGDMVDDAGFAAMGIGAAEFVAEMTSPVAAFTSGGPARKIVPWLWRPRTMTVSSHMAGT